MSWDEQAFKEKLEGTHSFPGPYTFKFIVTTEKQETVEGLIEGAEVSVKPSSGNKYVSVTLNSQMQTGDEVIAVYKKANTIEGLIAL